MKTVAVPPWALSCVMSANLQLPDGLNMISRLVTSMVIAIFCATLVLTLRAFLRHPSNVNNVWPRALKVLFSVKRLIY